MFRPLTGFPNTRVERDETFDNSFSKNRMVVPNIPITNSSPIPDGQIIVNKNDGLLYYSSNREWRNLDSAGGVSLSITTGEQNIQMGAMGDINGPPTMFYFGTQLGPTGGPPTASLIPQFGVFNNGGFIEDITSSAGGPGYSTGAPGWKVPVNGKYEISVSTTIGGSLDGVNNPANVGFLGVGSPLNVNIGVAKNNFGSFTINVTGITYVWTSPPAGIDAIYFPLSGILILDLTTSDVLYVGLNVQNKNTAVTLINATMSVKLLYTP